MNDRLSCSVPFCRRTIKDDGGEWICQRHWMAVSPTMRRRKYLFFRRYKKRFGRNGYWLYPAGSPDRLEAVRLDRLCRKAWEACKRAAIERAAGI
jgi:hypothetical protein